jgi:hypothetical protein
MKHELVSNAIVIGAHSCTATCTCGWSSGARFSSFVASMMFREHVEEHTKTLIGSNRPDFDPMQQFGGEEDKH